MEDSSPSVFAPATNSIVSRSQPIMTGGLVALALAKKKNAEELPAAPSVVYISRLYHLKITTHYNRTTCRPRALLLLRSPSPRLLSVKCHELYHLDVTKFMMSILRPITTGWLVKCIVCNTLQHTATHCNTLQHTATHCNTLQHTATHCDTLQHTNVSRPSQQNGLSPSLFAHLLWSSPSRPLSSRYQ